MSPPSTLSDAHPQSILGKADDIGVSSKVRDSAVPRAPGQKIEHRVGSRSPGPSMLAVVTGDGACAALGLDLSSAVGGHGQDEVIMPRRAEALRQGVVDGRQPCSSCRPSTAAVPLQRLTPPCRLSPVLVGQVALFEFRGELVVEHLLEHGL